MGQPPEDDEREERITMEIIVDCLAVPLSQLEGVAVDDETRQAIEDWHYWVARGHGF
jgi:hypothetical protein